VENGCPSDVRARFAAVVGRPVEPERREARWLAMSDDVVAFAADDDAAWQRLASEAWLVERWRAAGIPAPRILASDAARRVQVREKLHGLTGDAVHTETARSPLYAGELPGVAARLAGAALSAFGQTLAHSYGELAARIRRAVTAADARAAGLDETPHRRLDLERALACLDASDASAAAKAIARRRRTWLAAIAPPDAVIHGDLHFHNMCVAPHGAITGVFDLGDAGLDDPAIELMYIDSLGSRFAEAAITAYGTIDRDAVHRAHLRTALDHVLHHGPGMPRHASVVAWATDALEHIG
jgi:phosphotransferase family enzyme